MRNARAGGGGVRKKNKQQRTKWRKRRDFPVPLLLGRKTIVSKNDQTTTKQGRSQGNLRRRRALMGVEDEVVLVLLGERWLEMGV